MAKAASDEKIPVYIWTLDIDQTAVDTEVESRTGLTRDNLAVIDEEMSEELAIRLAALENTVDSNVFSDFQEYFRCTEASRKLEQERTDTFIDTRREICRGRYIAQNTKFTSDNRISEENIIFSSRYSPMIIAEMTVEEIEKTTKNNKTVSLSVYKNAKVETTVNRGTVLLIVVVVEVFQEGNHFLLQNKKMLPE